MTDDCMECLCDNNPICMEQARLILDLLKEIDNEKTTSGIYKKSFKQYFDYIKNEDWVFLDDGCYKVIKFTHDEYDELKNVDIMSYLMKGSKEGSD